VRHRVRVCELWLKLCKVFVAVGGSVAVVVPDGVVCTHNAGACKIGEKKTNSRNFANENKLHACIHI